MARPWNIYPHVNRNAPRGFIAIWKPAGIFLRARRVTWVCKTTCKSGHTAKPSRSNPRRVFSFLRPVSRVEFPGQAPAIRPVARYYFGAPAGPVLFLARNGQRRSTKMRAYHSGLCAALPSPKCGFDSRRPLQFHRSVAQWPELAAHNGLVSVQFRADLPFIAGRIGISASLISWPQTVRFRPLLPFCSSGVAGARARLKNERMLFDSAGERHLRDL